MIIPALTPEELNARSINGSASEFLTIKKIEDFANERNWIIIRSFKLEHHPNKIEGEIDLVIFTNTHGIILIEVKGSQLKCIDRTWSVYNRGKASWAVIQDPFEQMRDAYYAFNDALFPITRRFNNVKPLVSWCCVFPESDGIRGTAEYPAWRFCTAERFNDIELFFDQLVKKEKGKKNKRDHSTNLNPKFNGKIIENLVPMIENGNYIRKEYNDTLIELEKESELVHRLMDAFSSNDVIFAEGAAGTGKTRAAIFECKRLAQEGSSFLFWCRSELLAMNVELWLNYYLDNGSSKVFHGEELPSDIDLFQFDVLLIDEAQDLVHLEVARNIILHFHENKKKIRLFGDFALQNLYASKEDLLSWFEINNIQLTKSRLSTNCRNTKQIGANIRKLAGFDDSVFSLSSTQGENLTYRLDVPESNILDEVRKCMADWKSKDQPLSGITILTYMDENSANYQEISTKLGALPHRDSFVLTDRNSPTIANIMEFKGLESPCIILIVTHMDKDWKKIFYTAISRAILKCYIIFSDKINNEDSIKILC